MQVTHQKSPTSAVKFTPLQNMSQLLEPIFIDKIHKPLPSLSIAKIPLS
jgi:hypothetical protein